MEIKWTGPWVQELNNIVTYLKKNRIGEILEYLGNYFIEKHLKFTKIENYSMGFIDNVDVDIITDGEYKLAFICELSSNYHGKFLLKEKKVQERYKKPFKSSYSCFSYMIKYCVVKNYHLHYYKLTYEEFYLNSLLKGALIPKEKIKNKDDPLLNKIGFSYYLVTEIMKIEEKNPGIIFLLTSLISETENLDISLFSPEQIRNIKYILKTKRTIFIRFLLVLTFEILKVSKILEPKWLMKKLSFSNHQQFLKTITSPLIEVIIFITANNIKMKY